MKTFFPFVLLASIPAYALAEVESTSLAVTPSTALLGVGFVLVMVAYAGFFVWKAIQHSKHDEKSGKEEPNQAR